MLELPDLPELWRMLEIARENGYEGTYDEFKRRLIEDPASLPFPRTPLAAGGIPSLMYLLQ
tara:strand:- start:1299 stop:1481 length:183 start_codon:yes stop_codon:yes gene_type:complete